MIVDTGSTITYVPCASCGRNCGPHHKVLRPLPNPDLVPDAPQPSRLLKQMCCQDICLSQHLSPQCEPRRFAPLQDAAFDPEASSTSARIPCSSDKCACGRPPCGCSDTQLCTYQRTYGGSPDDDFGASYTALMPSSKQPVCRKLVDTVAACSMQRIHGSMQ